MRENGERERGRENGEKIAVGGGRTARRGAEMSSKVTAIRYVVVHGLRTRTVDKKVSLTVNC